MTTRTPNVLLIVADDLGVDTLRIDDAADTVLVQLKGTAAYPLPSLSRLVAKGIHFTRAWAHPVCSPSRATLFTGIQPWRHGVGDPIDDPALPPALVREGGADLKTLANFVSDASYQTAILGKWDLGDDPHKNVPTLRGWHHHEGILAGGLRPLDPNPKNKVAYEQIIQHDVRYVSWAKTICDVQSGVKSDIKPEDRPYKYATEDSVFSARDWIIAQSGKPWWVTLALIAPHVPFHVPPKGTYTIPFKDPQNPTDQEMFVAMMEAMDYYLGRLFDDPQLQDQLQNTVIIFVGDNGTDDTLDDKSGDDKNAVYIGGIHVPLLIADGGSIFGNAPCFLAPHVISSEQDKFVHIIDLFQTIIDIAGGHGPTAYKSDSISLLPYLKGSAAPVRDYIFSQFYVPNNPDAIKKIPTYKDRYEKYGSRATISDGTYKLNYQNGRYDFSELHHNSATDQTTEIVTNNFKHPKAKELWQALTTPGSGYYAETDSLGGTFPPLPEHAPLIFGKAMRVALKADSGNYLARCNGCIPGAAYPDSAFVHVPPADMLGSPWAQFTLRDLENGKYALQADSGNYLARCNGCSPGAAYPDSAFVHVSPADLAGSPWAQFTLRYLDNGKYALQADSGNYLARCNNCSPGAYPDRAFVHVSPADLAGSPWAQWEIVILVS
ncbi:MAG: sulfatase-like hydrolase/transferase [Oscillochloris sp.]|nr:sulfatase-like hydrolase/transferase [Oscillochloris sp.]